MTPRRARWLAVAGIAAIAAIAQLAGLASAWRYDRAAIAAGEVWRLLTGHLVHLGPMHLALNAAGLALVAALVGARLPLSAWAAAFLVSALAIGAGLWLGSPGLDWYVGLSGVLHGLLVAGAVGALRDPAERRLAAAVLIAVAAKLVWEQVAGPLPGTAQAAGGPVIVDAHLYGALGGALAAAGEAVWHAARAGAVRPPRP